MSPARPSDGPARWWSEGAGGHINPVCRLIEPHVAGARGRHDSLNNSVLVGAGRSLRSALTFLRPDFWGFGNSLFR